MLSNLTGERDWGNAVRITIKVIGLQQARKAIDRAKALAEDTEPLAFAALNGTADLFEKNFRAEGALVGGWASLAERTIADRESKGFGGEHPILVRYGDLRQVTATSLKAVQHSGTVTMTDSDGKSIGVQIKGRRGTLNVTAFGDKALNQEPDDDRPARPYWWVDNRVQQAARKAVVERLSDELGKL